MSLIHGNSDMRTSYPKLWFIFANSLIFTLLLGCACSDSRQDETVEDGSTFWNGVVDREFSIYTKSPIARSGTRQLPNEYMVVTACDVEGKWSQIVHDGIRSDWSGPHALSDLPSNSTHDVYQNLFRYDVSGSSERPPYKVVSFIVNEAYQVTKSFWPNGVYKSSFNIDCVRFEKLYEQGYYDDLFFEGSMKLDVPMFMRGVSQNIDQSVRVFIVDIEFDLGSYSCMVDPNRAAD